MSNYKFNPSERYAIYTLHNEKCYICKKPIDLKTMKIDHIIPESLLEKKEELETILKNLGRKSDFNINSYENWMPSCDSCNNTKSDMVFESTPLVQILLQDAESKKNTAIALAEKTITDQKIARALNIIEQATEKGLFVPKNNPVFEDLLNFHNQQRNEELKNEPLRLTPHYEILSNDRENLVIRGPYGIGIRPLGPNVHSSFDCPNCGSRGAWNGARCVVCGQMDED